jgi:DNA-binding CsgD family transcriptional regulator
MVSHAIGALQPREQRVLGLLADGYLYKEISTALGISYALVHKLQHKVFQKLGVTNRTELAKRWWTIYPHPMCDKQSQDLNGMR